MKPKCGLLSFAPIPIVLLLGRSQKAVHAYLSDFVFPSWVAGDDSDVLIRDPSQEMSSYSALLLVSKPQDVQCHVNKVLMLQDL